MGQCEAYENRLSNTQKLYRAGRDTSKIHIVQSSFYRNLYMVHLKLSYREVKLSYAVV